MSASSAPVLRDWARRWALATALADEREAWTLRKASLPGSVWCSKSFQVTVYTLDSGPVRRLGGIAAIMSSAGRSQWDAAMCNILS